MNKLPIFIFCAVWSWIFLFMCTPIWSNDIWWHLATGKYILAKGKIPQYDWFTYTCAHRIWIDLHWLYQLWQYFLYSLGGLAALIVTKSLVILIAITITIYPLIKEKNWLIAAWLGFLASFVFNHRALVRPEIYSYVFFALYLYYLEKYRQQQCRHLYYLPLLQIIWCNTQGLFILGIGLIGIFFIDELIANFRLHRKITFTPLGKVLILCTIACFINPYGWQGASFPFTLFQVIQGADSPMWQKHIGEFRRLLPLNWCPWPVKISLITILILPLLRLLHHRDKTIRYHLLYFVFLALALLAMRNMPFIVMVSLAIFSIKPLTIKQDIIYKISSAILLLLAMLAIFLLLAQKYYPSIKNEQNLGDARKFGVSGVIEGRYPTKAVKFIMKNSLPGNIFHHLDDGGYLIWTMFPKYRVFVDPRLEVMGAKHFSRYQKMHKDFFYFEKMCRKYNIKVAIVRESPVFQDLFANNPYWRVVFRDYAESTFVLQRK